ncbi:MAG: hypothetical protein BRC49_08710 [Cyanobacteria bacterium SW_10_48_33]|nr:MAG: hypothetical protein BRC49_08710 [Cyanobacteria bacterium SW_10_48_33]
MAPIENLRTGAREASEEDEIHAFKHTHALTPHCRTPRFAKFQQVESIQNRWNRSIKTENLATKIQKKAKVTAFLGRILTLPSLKAWGFSLLRESLESTELNPDTFPDLKTAQRAFFGIALIAQF